MGMSNDRWMCNDCWRSMQNCHDMSICCEDETGLCDFFEEIPTERRTDGQKTGS